MTVRSHDAGGALVSHGYRAWLLRVGLNHPNAKCGPLAEEFRLDGGLEQPLFLSYRLTRSCV